MLVANRGEIALRIARTARALGIATVAVYEADDARSPHVRGLDLALPVRSYLDAASIVEAARLSGADAVHPGYGFLAENADFAEACESAGLVFVGPAASVIRAMGMKDAAREAAVKAGVAVVPAYTSGEFPVLIKAAAGGGGRGMRIVRSAGELDGAVEAARGEAERAFGNGTLLLERFVEGARHIEVQIFGDQQGNVIHLYERDCSVQRRHQKVIEESPSPAVTPQVRERICSAAVALGQAIGYTNAGTVEFLLAPSGEFYFIEMNTRIQVEHPVTELVSGLDLIRLQIEVAEGRSLEGLKPAAAGHAIEARLYAEDPAKGFMPSAGTLHVWRPPATVRVDAGVEEGSEIGVRYDPMLAKFTAWARDRESAVRKLVHALRSTVAAGVETNREYLIRVLESEDFRDGRAHTGWALDYGRDDSRDELMARAAAPHFAQRVSQPLPGVARYWRNNPFQDPVMALGIGDRVLEIPVNVASTHMGVYECGPGLYVHSIDGAALVARVERFKQTAVPTHGTASSPMPGLVLRVLAGLGQAVKAGDALVVLEAMKMEQTIKTAIDGRVSAVRVKPGDVVSPGQTLVEVDAENDAGEGADGHARGTKNGE